MIYALAALNLTIVFGHFMAIRAERSYWAGLLAQQSKDAHAREDKLLNRIQSPEVAVYESVEPAPGPDYVSMYEEFLPEVSNGD